VKALIRTAQEAGNTLHVLKAVETANDLQKQVLGNKILARFGDKLSGRRIAIWGLAFKANTDDMREAASRDLITTLLEHGAEVTVYDPKAMDEARHIFGGINAIRYARSPMAALQGADALAIVTEWKEFRSPDFDAVRGQLKEGVIFDGRNLYDPMQVRGHGLEYHAIGRQ